MKKNPEDNLKTVINDFVTNQLLPFIEKNMDNIIEYHQTKIDKSCRREKQNLEKIKNVLLDKATITKIEPRTGKDKFNPEMHLQMREEQNTKVPDMIVLEIIRDGYYCNATQTVIRKAGVVVNYNFSG
ncbi:MAG: hypothetical protein OMM_08281 [Candidatus Magnetoglobus multicellularis str. Araruama]|uniref:Molecular chaperone GrpE n=1 Tax=Candidatus Magnetoglobus multicellularis str. Araruama TaxID=890399 RepID=A0A1V1P8S5_9BACT|nr:MAG: hypothetical protein OMM_08281 [Candidatus Magnetoglobus multicellularis str. Araruama]